MCLILLGLCLTKLSLVNNYTLFIFCIESQKERNYQWSGIKACITEKIRLIYRRDLSVTVIIVEMELVTCPWERHESLSYSSARVKPRFSSLGKATSQGERKLWIQTLCHILFMEKGRGKWKIVCCFVMHKMLLCSL